MMTANTFLLTAIVILIIQTSSSLSITTLTKEEHRRNETDIEAEEESSESNNSKLQHLSIDQQIDEKIKRYQKTIQEQNEKNAISIQIRDPIRFRDMLQLKYSKQSLAFQELLTQYEDKIQILENLQETHFRQQQKREWDTFDRIDDNNDDQLCRMEFNNAMVHMKSDADVLTTAFIHRIKIGVGVDDTFEFEDWDHNKNGFIDFEEYSRHIIMLRDWDEFQQPDLDGDFMISESEFHDFINDQDLMNYPSIHPRKPAATSNTKTTNTMNRNDDTESEGLRFQDFDRDQDGYITFQEYGRQLSMLRNYDKFQQRDLDGDDRITRTEFDQFKERFNVIDDNKDDDNKQKYRPANFEEMDSDNNGFIDFQEFVKKQNNKTKSNKDDGLESQLE